MTVHLPASTSDSNLGNFVTWRQACTCSTVGERLV
uniref:Uncharacterized protein n=1 Tax=Anguilla anguilla TaxID=7936 RepID=A0A0E9SY76_ANGAN